MRDPGAPSPLKEVSVNTEVGLTQFGLSEQELRDGLEEELLRAMRAEGDAPTVHAIAHAIARTLERDHLRIAEQLVQSGIRLGPGAH